MNYMKNRSNNLPAMCAVACGSMAGLPFLIQAKTPVYATLVACIVGFIFISIGLCWKQVIKWAYRGTALPENINPNFAESIDQRIWRFIQRSAYPAFVLLGVSLPAKFYLDAHPFAEETLKLSGGSLVIVILAWFAPLWIQE
jgi:hypothetical protein